MDHLISERDGHVVTITMNRPDRLNAISGPMLAEMSRLLVDCDADRDVRAVVLTGAGRGFCSGLDLQDLAAGQGLGSDPGGLGTRIDDTPPFVLRRLDVPVICRLNGPAAGYGMDLALGCDVVIASDRASLAPPVRRSALPESGGTWLLPRLVGWHKASEVTLFGRRLDAAEMLRLGLVNTVVAADDLDATVASWAAEVAAMPPLAVRAAKRAMRLGLDATFEANSHHVMAELLNLFRTDDFKESLASFLEKRPATYRGR
ncbi:MAG: enoyl-CoA hydratase-related protein [Actinomycetota bacterium]|nr:enoyl-CoA hydratase-related protein [Actinomycetota bacterium]